MYFYRVWVRSARFHGKEALTYSYPKKIPVGTIVQVPLQQQSVLGVIVEGSSKPEFTTKQLEPLDCAPLPASLISLAQWLKEYYPSPLGAIAQIILPPALSKRRLSVAEDDKDTKPQTSKLPALTAEQKQVIARVNLPDTYLLHGRTGSGKTRVYIELALSALAQGRSAVILTPEIGLTSQLASNFRDVFGTRVVVLHSSLAPAERQSQWLRVLNSKLPLIVIGPRSALFAPLKNIGLIVIDEAHEAAYKQEQAPHYHASRAAARLAQLHNAPLVLGSATPSIGDYFLAEQRHKPILELTQLPQGNTVATSFKVVDVKDRTQFRRSSQLSDPLIKAVEKALAKQEQVLLYLNRRGTARLVMCERCGWQAVCPHCNLPLTYHGDSHNLRCHTCGYRQPPLSACPVCHHSSVIFKTGGTKALAVEVHKLFPQALVQRFDTDNLKADRLEQHYDAIRSGKVNILIGTQLVAKGLDLPSLSTVGVVLADTSLYLPDFTAYERTYQLLKQVIGRVNRGHRPGTAVIQTYHPTHSVVKAATEKGWRDFYSQELAQRKQYLFPPFSHLLKLTCRRASPSSAEQAATKLKQLLESHKLPLRIDGPAPAFHEQFQNKYQWQLVVKSSDRKALLAVVGLIPTSGWTYDIDPTNLL